MDGLFLTSYRHWWERVTNTVIEFHLSNTSRSRRARTRIAHLVDRDADDCYFPAPGLGYHSESLTQRNVLQM